MSRLTVSLVVYHSDEVLFEKTLRSLKRATDKAREEGLLDDALLKVVDNAMGASQQNIASIVTDVWGYHGVVITPSCNLGYGLAHNLAMQAGYEDYYLVINPDIEVHERAIIEAIHYLQKHAEVGLVSPCSHQPNGASEYLCKTYPSVFVLLIRGFAPQWLKKYFDNKIAEYEQRDLAKARHDIVIASGCFMFFRGEAVAAVKGFSPDFFLYFEDFDLSLRLTKQWRIAFLPTVKIVHYGGRAAKKGFKHIFLFAQSAIIFFNKHGWRIW